MRIPFALPVRIEDGEFLVAADCELIASLTDATPAERAFIVKALNVYPLLIELRHCADLNLDEGLDPTTIALLDRVDAVL